MDFCRAVASLHPEMTLDRLSMPEGFLVDGEAHPLFADSHPNHLIKRQRFYYGSD